MISRRSNPAAYANNESYNNSDETSQGIIKGAYSSYDNGNSKMNTTVQHDNGTNRIRYYRRMSNQSTFVKVSACIGSVLLLLVFSMMIIIRDTIADNTKVSKSHNNKGEAATIMMETPNVLATAQKNIENVGSGTISRSLSSQEIGVGHQNNEQEGKHALNDMYTKYSDFKLSVVQHVQASEEFLESSILKRSNVKTTSTHAALDDYSNIHFDSNMAGKDVIVLTGGCHNIGRYLLETIQRGYARMSGPLTFLVLDVAVADDDHEHRECDIDVKTDLPIFVAKSKVDIRHARNVYETLQPYKERIRGVIHLAATAQVQQCQTDLDVCKQVNVQGTENILKTMTRLFLSAAEDDRFYLPWLLFASSREVYGGMDIGDPPVTELSPVKPLNEYGQSKWEAEQSVEKWVQETGFNAVVVRFTNVYGGCYDHQTRLVPKTISFLLNDNILEIYGSAQKTVSLLHISDAVQGLLLATQYLTTLQDDGNSSTYEVFNIGGGSNHDVLNIAELMTVAQAGVASVVGSKNCVACQKPPTVVDMFKIKGEAYAPEPEHFRSSIEKATRLLGFVPSKTFNEETVTEFVNRCAPVIDIDAIRKKGAIAQVSDVSNIRKLRRRDLISSASADTEDVLLEMQRYFLVFGLFFLALMTPYFNVILRKRFKCYGK